MTTYIPHDVKVALVDSNRRNEIVFLDYSEERHEALAALASDWTEANDANEYWAEDLFSDEIRWRVHLVRRDD